MKQALILIISLLFLTNCSSDDTVTILGKWKLIQVLADPGDGSGVFRDIESKKTITFFSDETFEVNQNLCYFDPNGSGETNGNYSEKEEKIYPTNCESFAMIGLNYKIEKNIMIINFQCIEACAEAYIKIE